MYNFQIKRGNRKSLTSVHCNWNVPFCLLSLKIRGECRDGPWDVFVASQCFGSQVLSNHPGKGTSSLKMSKNEDHFTIFFGKKTFTLYYIQLLLDDPRQIQAARPEPSLFAPPFLPSHQTPQYCTTPAANWRFCRVLGCWGPVFPIWIAQSWSYGVARCLLAISLICQTCTMLSIFSKKWDLWSWAGFSEKEN